MSSQFIIKNVTNPKDGAHCHVTLSGTPSGTLSFRVGRSPRFADSVATTFTAANDVYAVAVPHPSLWYVWATDSHGTTDDAASQSQNATWVGLSDNPDLDLTGMRLRDLLAENSAGLTAGLQTWFPNTTLKQVVYGSEMAVRQLPAILVTRPRETVEWAFLPMGRVHTYHLEIMLLIIHQDAATMLPMAVRFMGRVMEVLNQPTYEGLQLESGLKLAFCAASSGEANETQLDENAWACAASLLWSGQALKQDVGVAETGF